MEMGEESREFEGNPGWRELRGGANSAPTLPCMVAEVGDAMLRGSSINVVLVDIDATKPAKYDSETDMTESTGQCQRCGQTALLRADVKQKIRGVTYPATVREECQVIAPIM